MKRQSEAAAVSPGYDDLRGRTFDATGNGKMGGDFPPQFKFTAWVRVNGCCARFDTNGMGADSCEQCGRKCLLCRYPIWKMAGPWVISWYISMNEPGSGGCSDRATARGRSATWVPVARDATMSCAADSFS